MADGPARADDSRHSGKVTPAARLRDPAVHLAVLLALSVALGGGGVAYGLRNLAVQLAALAVLAANRDAVLRFVRNGPRALVWLVGASLALPLLQLVPLPAALWQALPGRGVVAESFALAGLGADRWFSFSLDPMRTLVAFCGTLAPAAIIAVGSTLDPARVLRLAGLAAILAFGALVLGIAQLASANDALLLYPVSPKPDLLYATFANRNSTALFFVLAVLLAGMAPGPCWARVAGMALLALGALLTQSRSGVALLGGALVAVMLLGIWQYRSSSLRSLRMGMAAGGAALLALLLVLAGTDRLADSIARLGDTATDRGEVWEDSLYAARQYAPLGSGMGTFDEVFQLHESLEYVSPRRAGRAHNDWLEIAIEGSVPALALALAWLAWCALASLRGGGDAMRIPRLLAGVGLACIALQSMLDYPLRNQTLLCMAALLVAVLAVRKERA